MAGSSAGVDVRQTQTPFIATSRSAGSNCAVVVPMLARTRPQLGSLPKTAALKRLLRATLRLTSTASSSVAAWSVVMAISWSAPSASLSSCMARSVQAWVSAAVKSSGVGVMPLAPLAMTVTVSLVDMQPSESSRSKLTAGRGAQRGVELGGRDDGVGGDHDEHRRERGREHPGALGHPADRPAGALDDDVLADRVGGHDRLGGLRSPVGGERRGGRLDARPAGRRGRWRARSARSSRRPRRWRRCRGPRRPSRPLRGWSGSPRGRCSSWRRRS